MVLKDDMLYMQGGKQTSAFWQNGKFLRNWSVYLPAFLASSKSPLCDTNFLSLNCENWIVSFKIHQWLTLTKTYPSLAYDIVVTTWWHCGTTMPTKIKWLWQICSWNQTQQALSLKWMSCMRVIFARVGQMLTLSWPEFNHSSAACDNN